MKSISNWLKGTWLVLLVAAIVVILDQLSKEWVRVNIEKYSYIIPIPQFGKYFVIEHVMNTGAAFGIMQNRNYLLTVVVIGVIVAILDYSPRIPPDQKLIRVFLGMQLGGALGNLIDRFVQGHVTDFIRIGIPGVYYWPSFNIADSAVIVGVIGLGVIIVRDDIRRERDAKAERAAESAAGTNSKS